jgi:hypothetical protein
MCWTGKTPQSSIPLPDGHTSSETQTPVGWNDPLYPDIQPPLRPYPFNPARYEQRRTLRIGAELSWQ